tara:strand:+ start:693 stop:902 length:210 start_codon:yes stop_codon:yes gene_type:complete
MNDFKTRVITLTSEHIVLKSQMNELYDRMNSNEYDIRSKKVLKRDYREVVDKVRHCENNLKLNIVLAGE